MDSDSTTLVHIISSVRSTEVNSSNLGVQSHVKVSFELAEYTGNVNPLGPLRLLDAIRTCGFEKIVETTLFDPRSPHGVAKTYGYYWITVNYREAYGIYACNGVLFNHENSRRGRTFVTQKISRTAALEDIHLGKHKPLYLPGQLEFQGLVGRSADLSRAFSAQQLLLSRGTTTSTVAPPTSIERPPLHRFAQTYAFRALPLMAYLTFVPVQVTTRSSSCTMAT